jgi:hypothetical protein
VTVAPTPDFADAEGCAGSAAATFATSRSIAACTAGSATRRNQHDTVEDRCGALDQ